MSSLLDKCDVLVFDWDGTLVDSISPLIELLADAARETPLTEQGCELKCSGLLPVLQQIIFAEQSVQVKDIKLLLRLAGVQEFNKKPVLFEGIAPMLATLHDMGQTMAVVAGCPQHEVVAQLQMLGIAPYFVCVMGGGQWPDKPNPAMLQAVLTQTQCSPQRALMVGDSPLDMEMAMLAEIPAIGVAYLSREYEDYCINRLKPWQPLLIARSVEALSQALTGHRTA